MAASRDLALPLVFVCLVLFRGYASLPTASRAAETKPTRPQAPSGFTTDEDYNSEDPTTEIPVRVSPNTGKPEKCDYNPCRENQTPCSVLKQTGCFCPGFTLPNDKPETPKLRSVSWNGSEVVIKWCAPYSYVTGYTVTVGGKERHTFGESHRSGGVGDLENIEEVCVRAVNDVGHSDKACEMYHPRDRGLPLTAGLIGGALGLLLLILLAVLLWRHRRQRKQEASISMHDTAEAQ